MSDDVPKPMFEYVRIMQGWGPVEVQYVCNTYIYIYAHTLTHPTSRRYSKAMIPIVLTNNCCLSLLDPPGGPAAQASGN